MIEKEVRGYIKNGDFVNKIAYFTKHFSKPNHSVRLSLALADFSNPTLETRIRITNANVEIVQKVGELKAIDREEITINLEKISSEHFLNLFLTYKNFLKDVKNPMMTLIQNENFVFKNDKVEIKLFRQFGKSEFFAFEVEALIEMNNAEIYQFCEENGLEVDENYNDYNSIQNRNQKVNIDLVNIENSELENIIKSYL